MSFDSASFQADAFQVDTDVTTDPVDIRLAVAQARVGVANGALVGSDVRFAVVGLTYGLMGRRFTIIGEQVEALASISIPATIIFETFEMDLRIPTALVVFETFEVDTETPSNLVVFETFELAIGAPTTEVILETFESL